MSSQSSPANAIAAWPALLSAKLAAAYTSQSERNVWKGAACGDFPKPVKLPNCRKTVWRKDDVDAWMESLTQ